MTDFQRANLAQKLLTFGKALEDMTKFSAGFEDLDWSEGYPFHLLDIETITPAVVAWTNIHINRLMAGVVVTVINPAWVTQGGWFTNTLADGILPEIGYDPKVIYSWLERQQASVPAPTYEQIYNAYCEYLAALKETFIQTGMLPTVHR